MKSTVIDAIRSKEVWVPSLLLVVLWGIQIYLDTHNMTPAYWGILPLSPEGITGIITSPFVHGDYMHLLNNSLPLAILTAYMLKFYPELTWKVMVWGGLATGLCVWISARHSYHIGASGVVYVLIGFLFLSGIIRRNILLMGISASIVFLYGSLIWGIFPIEEGVSWESHLWGLVTGLAFALYYRNVGVQKKRYPWEVLSEEEYLSREIELFGNEYWMGQSQTHVQPMFVMYYYEEKPKEEEPKQLPKKEPQTFTYVYTEKE